MMRAYALTSLNFLTKLKIRRGRESDAVLRHFFKWRADDGYLAGFEKMMDRPVNAWFINEVSMD
jgi:hypothetical protein